MYAWPDVQAALCFFRLRICAKFKNFLRLTDPTAEYSNSLVEKLPRLVQLGLSFIINAFTVSDPYTEINYSVWQQATLPPKNGGIGMANPRRNHISAYLATFIAGSFSKFRLESALRYVKSISPVTETENSVHQIQQCILRDNTLIQTLFSTLINTYKLKSIVFLWRKLLFRKSRSTTYLDFFTIWSQEDIIRLASCCHEGGVFTYQIYLDRKSLS